MSDEYEPIPPRHVKTIVGVNTMELADLRRKADAFDAELAAREATEREAAVPIDDEWLISMGFRDEDEYGSSYSNRWIVLRKTADGVWMLWVNGGMYSAYVGHIGKTRGNVLALMRAFGIKDQP